MIFKDAHLGFISFWYHDAFVDERIEGGRIVIPFIGRKNNYKGKINYLENLPASVN